MWRVGLWTNALLCSRVYESYANPMYRSAGPEMLLLYSCEVRPCQTWGAGATLPELLRYVERLHGQQTGRTGAQSQCDALV